MFKILRPVIFTILALLVFWFFVRPTFAEVRVLQAEVDEYRTVVEQAVSFNRLLNSLLAKKNSFNVVEIERINAISPDDIDEVRALVDIQALAEQHGLVFSGVDEAIDEAPDAEGANDTSFEDSTAMLEQFDSRTIGFTVAGEYDQFKDFLRDMERSLMIIDVEKIVFFSTGLNIASYQLEVRLYGTPSPEAI